MARIMERRMFLPDAGRITVAAAYHRETPRAQATSSYFSFSFSMVSQQEDTRKGRSITASRIPAARTQEPVGTPAFKNSFTNTCRPTNP